MVGLRPYRRGRARMEVEQLGDTTLAHNYGHGGSGITVCWGASRVVVEQLCQSIQGPTEVAVLGAGAMGLCGANLLCERGHKVKVYAQDFPPNTTSNVAGGLWAPTHMEVGAGAEEQARHRQILDWSWKSFERLLGSDYGISMVKLYESLNSPNPLDPMPRWLTGPAEQVEHFPFGDGVSGGSIWDTFLVETPVFLERLMQELRTHQASFETRTFESVEQLLALPEKVVLNCLGLGAGAVLKDNAVVPIRGQLVCLEPSPDSYVLDHGAGYIISRRDLLVLGGTFEEGVADTEVCPQSTEKILAGNRGFFSKEC